MEGTETGKKLGVVEAIEARLLKPHPANVRGKLKDEDVAALVASIRTVGILDPLIVRIVRNAGDHEDYQILSGHRRAAAAKVAELLSVPARTIRCSDEEALQLLVLANHDREEPDLFREADALEALTSKGWTVEDAADLLGKPRRFVAKMRAIAQLDPKVRKEMASEKCSWTPAMIETFSRLDPAVQVDRWKELKRGTYRMEDLQRFLQEDFHLLGSAKWALEDAALVPAAGACSVCPKTSLRAPGLFEDEELDPADPAALKKGSCRDAACWTSKSRAQLKVDLVKIEEETGKKPVLLSNAYGEERATLQKLGKLVPSYDTTPAKKGDRGAVPAIDVATGKRSWVKSHAEREEREGGSKKKGPAEKPKPLSTKERMERLFDRRSAWIVDHVRDELIPKSCAPRSYPSSVAILVGIFGGRPHYIHSTGDVRPGKLREYASSIETDDAAWAETTWERVKDPLQRFLTRLNLNEVGRQVDDAYYVAGLFGFERSTLVALAEAEIPTPKGLLKEVTDAIAAPAKPKKEKGPKKAKKKPAAAAAE